MRKLITLFIFSFLLGINSSFSQINFSEMLQPNKIARDEVSKLYFIDFWATWCAPCIHVSKYLTVLQKQYPEDFYIISLTNEEPEKVRKFLTKHNTKLAIAIDHDGETFYKNGISSLPSGILINAQGSILWEGHPAELKSEMIARFLRSNKKEISIEKIIKFHKKTEEQEFITYKPENNFEYFEDNSTSGNELKIIQSEVFLEFRGKLSSILAYASSSHTSQIKIDESIDTGYKMYFKKGTEELVNMTNVILSSLNLKQKIKSDSKDVIVLTLNNPRFWDAFQIELTNSSKRYEIGAMDLKADNITLSELGYVLGVVKDKPVVLNAITKENTIHDWQIHYKFFDLMQSDLKDNYGIEIEEKEIEVPLYKIIKKAP